MPRVVIRSGRQSRSASFGPSSVISRPRPSPVKRAAEKHSTSDEIDDDNNDNESSDDESSDSGASFDLGNVPHNSSASFPKPLGGFGGAAQNHVLVQRDYWADAGGLDDNETDGTLVDGEHDDQRDPNAVHADPSTPPAKPNRPPPPVEAPDAASHPWARHLLARELQARAGNCASPPGTPHDGGAVRALTVLRVGCSSAMSDEVAAVQRRIIFNLRATRVATRGEDDTAPPMPDPKLFTTVSKDDADVLETRSWSSLWHDVLCGGDGEGGGAGRIDELDVDGAVDGGVCFVFVSG